MSDTGSSADLADGPLSDEVSFLLARANALSLAGANAALAQFDLRVRSYAVLNLATVARPSQRMLAEYLRLDPSQIVSLVDGLEARGWVRREPDASDRRTKVVVATPEGLGVRDAAAVLVRDTEDHTLQPLNAVERVELRRLLQKMAFPAGDHVG